MGKPGRESPAKTGRDRRQRQSLVRAAWRQREDEVFAYIRQIEKMHASDQHYNLAPTVTGRFFNIEQRNVIRSKLHFYMQDHGIKTASLARRIAEGAAVPPERIGRRLKSFMSNSVRVDDSFIAIL